MHNQKQEWVTSLLAARTLAEGDVSRIHELRQTKRTDVHYLSARVLVNHRQIRHRHILFATPEAAAQAFESLLRDPSQNDELDEFWTILGATEVRNCGNDPCPPGAEHMFQDD